MTTNYNRINVTRCLFKSHASRLDVAAIRVNMHKLEDGAAVDRFIGVTQSFQWNVLPVRDET